MNVAARTISARRPGFTLAEMLVAMVILGLIGGMVMTTYVSGAGLAIAVQNQDSAERQLCRALSELYEGITAARAVSLAGPNRIELAMAATDSVSGRLTLPQRTGGYVAYYLSNNTGNPASTGTYLWRATKGTGPNDQWVAGQPAAEKVQQIAFSYTGDKSQVTVAVTTKAGRTGHEVVAQGSSVAKLRNKLQ